MALPALGPLDATAERPSTETSADRSDPVSTRQATSGRCPPYRTRAAREYAVLDIGRSVRLLRLCPADYRALLSSGSFEAGEGLVDVFRDVTGRVRRPPRPSPRATGPQSSPCATRRAPVERSNSAPDRRLRSKVVEGPLALGDPTPHLVSVGSSSHVPSSDSSRRMRTERRNPPAMESVRRRRPEANLPAPCVRPTQ